MTSSATQRTAGDRRSAFPDYLALAKPELTGLSVVTAIGATFLAFSGEVRWGAIAATAIGTAFTGAAAGALNELLEIRHDALMRRTEQRPLPAGRIAVREALLFGAVCAVIGTCVLWLGGTMAAGLLGVLTLVSYLMVYTPLKRHTPFATVIGGIPGALPPLIGWAVVHNGLTREAWSLFFILFFWQMPHFLALGWMYRKDYARAGYRLLVVIDAEGEVTARQSWIYAAAFIPAALMPTLIGLSGLVYFVGAFAVSGAFLFAALHFQRERSNSAARTLFFTSLAVLPAIFLLLVVDRLL